MLFSERLTNAAMVRARTSSSRPAASARCVHTVGLGPHTLNLEQRPEWFFDPARYGGILVDIGSHQVDQFLSFTGATGGRGARVDRPRRTPNTRACEVLGEMLLAADGRDAATPASTTTRPTGLAPAWGDVRFTVVGTEGYLEVRHVEQTVHRRRRRAAARRSTAPASRRAGATRYLAGTLVDPGARVRGDSRSACDAQARPAGRRPIPEA